MPYGRDDQYAVALRRVDERTYHNQTARELVDREPEGERDVSADALVHGIQAEYHLDELTSDL